MGISLNVSSPTISVVTVTYNSLATLRHTIASIADQAGEPVEHIVIDGGSTDGTVDLIRETPSIARFVSEPDAGIYDAMNKGLALSTGDYVGFLNADDLYASPTAVASLRECITSRRPDVIYGDLQYVDAKNTERVIRDWRAGEFSFGHLNWGWMPPHPTFYVRRDLLAELGCFDTKYRIAADYDFMTRYLLARGRHYAYVPQVLVKMRSGGVSNRSLANILRKSREDLDVIRTHGLGRYGTLLGKNLRKVQQFV